MRFIRRFRSLSLIWFSLLLSHDARGHYSLVCLLRCNPLAAAHNLRFRRYRPPELLFSAKVYTPAIDVWSAGCILAELFTGTVLFDGSSDITQMEKITLALGNVDVKRWPGALPPAAGCRVQLLMSPGRGGAAGRIYRVRVCWFAQGGDLHAVCRFFVVLERV